MNRTTTLPHTTSRTVADRSLAPYLWLGSSRFFPFLSFPFLHFFSSFFFFFSFLAGVLASVAVRAEAASVVAAVAPDAPNAAALQRLKDFALNASPDAAPALFQQMARLGQKRRGAGGAGGAGSGGAAGAKMGYFDYDDDPAMAILRGSDDELIAAV
jgi:hypothetical protein